MTILTVDDAVQLYMGCIVDHNGELYVVRDIASRRGTHHDLMCRKVSTGETVNIPADPDLVLCPTGDFRLGYVQWSSADAYYLSRTPRRQFRVGWCENNVRGLHMEAVSRLGAKFVNNIRGVFPEFKSAVKQSRGTGGIAAFDRQFAIGAGHHLYYCGNIMGYYDSDTDSVRLEGSTEKYKPLLLKAMGLNNGYN